MTAVVEGSDVFMGGRDEQTNRGCERVAAISAGTHHKCAATPSTGNLQSGRYQAVACGVPTILRHGRWRIFFYSNEGSEPAHVHVEAGEGTAKFWLTPVALVGSLALRSGELRDIERFVRQNRTVLLEAWNEHFGR